MYAILSTFHNYILLDTANWLPLDYSPVAFEESNEEYERRKKKKNWEKLDAKEKVKVFCC